jgi:hydroxymethylglutaryl-CoA synthase
MVEQALEEKYGSRSFKNCDALDMTFACIGGVDALQNAIDFVRVNPGKKAVVIASDYAKYELASGGVYTRRRSCSFISLFSTKFTGNRESLGSRNGKCF